MRGIYFNGTEATYREDLPKPVMSGNKSLIKIIMSAVCSTDKEILKGYRPDFKGIMGHEFVGIVEDSPRHELIGRRVVGEINEVCGKCLYCRSGRPHHCINRTTPGLSIDGCFAEYMLLDTANLHLVPDELPSEIAVFTEPLAAAFEILEQINIKPDTPVCVLGDGRLALCIANVLSLTDAKVTVIGKHPDKLDIFKQIGRGIQTTTELIPENYELVVEATGSPTGINQALVLVRKAGTIVLKSTYADNASINLSLVPVNEIEIIGSRCGPFEPALNALNKGEIVLPSIELHEPENFIEAFNSTAFKSGFIFSK